MTDDQAIAIIAAVLLAGERVARATDNNDFRDYWHDEAISEARDLLGAASVAPIDVSPAPASR